MSKKNQKHRVKPDNGYPLPKRTVLYSHKKYIQPVPEAGKRYHCFDDGKITFSRHYIIKVTEILGHNAFKKKYPELFKTYLEVTKDHYWLYSRSTDYFIVCEHGEYNKPGVYTRTKEGGWFGIGDWFNCGRLDVTGELWDNLVANIDDFDYSDEEKKRLIEENTL